MICSTPPSEPVVWRCYKLTDAGPYFLVSDPIAVASRTWFEARAIAATDFSTSPSEIWCELFPLADARVELLGVLCDRVQASDAREAA